LSSCANSYCSLQKQFILLQYFKQNLFAFHEFEQQTKVILLNGNYRAPPQAENEQQENGVHFQEGINNKCKEMWTFLEIFIGGDFQPVLFSPRFFRFCSLLCDSSLLTMSAKI